MNAKIHLAALLLFLLFLLLPRPGLSQNLPATFGSGKSSLQKLMTFPELRGDATARIRCASQVNNKGRMKSTGCYQNTAGDEVYIAVIVKAAKKARMIPATAAGKAFDVYVQFQVEFIKVGDSESIRVLNNPGLQENIDAYGDDHIAAQRGLATDSFTKACPKHARYMVWAKAYVGEDGQQDSFSILPGEGAPITEKCRAGIIATLRDSTFTPAIADGEPVPSSFIEPFGN